MDTKPAEAMTEAHTPTPELNAFRIGCSCERDYHTEAHPYDHGVVHRDKMVVARFPRFEDAEAYVLAVNSRARLLKEREELRAALEWYAKAGGCAETIEDAARGDIDLSDVSIALTEDCGDRARATLLTLKDKD